MFLSEEERLVLRAFELLRGYRNKDRRRRDELVLWTFSQVEKISYSGNYIEKYREFVKLIDIDSEKLKLIQKINEIINEMLASGKLEYCEERDLLPERSADWVSSVAVHYLSLGDKRLIRKSDSTNKVLDREHSLQLEENIRVSLQDSILSPTVRKHSPFQWREIFPEYREYTISRARWSDIDGETYVDVQFSPYYVVLVEYGHYVNVAVVDRCYYEKDSTPSLFLPKPYSSSRTEKNRKVEPWEPFEGLLQDCLSYLFHSAEAFQKSENYRQYKERVEKNNHNAEVYTDADLIHRSASQYASRLAKEKFWKSSKSDENVELPWWIIDAQRRRNQE